MRRSAFSFVVALAFSLAPVAAFPHSVHTLQPHQSGSAATAMGVASLLAAGTWILMRDH